ncbi:hypothetical protein HY086_05125 [Candidatus Gottesmanbacteria bacterium]|nr:hypothetical protein [Candidatus Gottesmanbacteria bacterium]
MKLKAPTLTYPDIQWLKSEFLPALADEVEKRLRDKLDEISKKLDEFVGDIEDKRETQELHSADHARINDRLDKHDQHLHISTAV